MYYQNLVSLNTSYIYHDFEIPDFEKKSKSFTRLKYLNILKYIHLNSISTQAGRMLHDQCTILQLGIVGKLQFSLIRYWRPQFEVLVRVSRNHVLSNCKMELALYIILGNHTLSTLSSIDLASNDLALDSNEVCNQTNSCPKSMSWNIC